MDGHSVCTAVAEGIIIELLTDGLFDGSTALSVIDITARNTGNQSGFGNGDSVLIRFSGDTNQPAFTNTAQIFNSITFIPPLPVISATAAWQSPRNLTLTFDSVNTSLPVPILVWSAVSITHPPTGPPAIRNAAGTAPGMTQIISSQNIFGAFGSPVIILLRALPNQRASFGPGNAFVIEFDVRMGLANVTTKAQVDSVINCSSPFGKRAYEIITVILKLTLID